MEQMVKLHVGSQGALSSSSLGLAFPSPLLKRGVKAGSLAAPGTCWDYCFNNDCINV